jgi:signal transduction histidine kinase/DNA-binding response OmpR family regulator/ligand-binding sensor domain-containing protein
VPISTAHSRRAFGCIALGLCLASRLLAASDTPPALDAEAGRPPVRVFTRAEHKAHQNFFAPWQSPEGPMYFGNQQQVVEYDGRTWRLLFCPVAYVRVMVAGPQGDLYLGDEDSLGVMTKPDSGEPQYRSLLDKVPAAAKPFGFVRSGVRWRDDLYFATEKNVLRWRESDQSFRVWTLPGNFRHRLFVAGPRLLLQRENDALYEFDGENFQPLSRDPALAQPGPAFVAAADAAADTLLVGLAGQGLFHLNRGGALVRWPNAAEEILRRTQVLTALRLRDGHFAIGTEGEGVVILGADGALVRHLTTAHGLPQPTAFGLCEDREGALWVSTNSGPARVDWRSAATLFDRQTSGLTDARANDILRYQGRLACLTGDGLYWLKPAADPTLPARFERDARVSVQAKLSSLLAHPAGLLLASAHGLQRLTATGLERLTEIPDGLGGLTASPTQPERIYFATTHGIGTGRFSSAGAWSYEGVIPGTDADCYDVIEDGGGTLWVGTVAKGVFRVRRPAGAVDWRAATVRRLGPAEGLPKEHGSIYLWASSLGLHFDTAAGIYRYEPATERFAAEAAMTAFTTEPIVLNPLARGSEGELWTNGLSTNAKVKAVPFPLLRLRAQGAGPARRFTAEVAGPDVADFFGTGGAHRIFWETGRDGGPGVVWGMGEQGLVRVDLAAARRATTLPAPLIREISAEGKPLVFPSGGPRQVALHFSPEPMTLTFVSGAFRRSDLERFQTRLVGFNAEWSAPTPRNDVTYTNLEGGPFRFEVRTVDRDGTVSATTGFAFTVTPPWQRSPAAYSLYALIAGGGVFGYIRWRLGRAARERVRLEALVATRTSELAVARDAAESASRAKSAFLASMSHELRTPLNGVLGYAQLLQGDKRLAPDQQERLRIVQQSGEHLLHMINDVLDLAKIEAGKLTLRPAPFAFGDLLSDIAAAHAPAAAGKRLSFQLDLAPDLPAWVEADAQKLRQVLDNLIGNAIKFTAKGGVTLRVRTNGEVIGFAVTDTGPGISLEDQQRLFQAFEQASTNHSTVAGTGLGLAISRALVERFGGRLTMESTPGQGSTFAFSLTLPVVAAGEPATAEGRRITGYAGRPQRVLIVDDHLINRRLLGDLLTPLGFACADYASPAEALARLADGSETWPDAAIIDLRMPEIDGLELTRRFRALPRGRELKILLTSASVIAFDPAEATRAGCDDFLPKPFRTAELLEKLGRLLAIAWSESGSAAPFPAAAVTPLPAPAKSTLREQLATGDLEAFTAELARQRAAHPESATALNELAAAAASFQLARLRQLLE